MTSSNLSVSKIVATPTENSWAQAYNAGSLFAVLSLTKSEESNEDLNSLGKEVFNNLEAEYFSLESKNLESIKNVILIVSDKIPEVLSCSFIVAVVFENILYLFSKGEGKVILRRQGKIGTILNDAKDTDEKIKTASGFLEDNDIFVLETESFENIITMTELSASLENNPSNAAEILSPKVHEKEEGGASAIIVKFQKPKEAMEEDLEKEEKPIDTLKIDAKESASLEILTKENKKLIPIPLNFISFFKFLKLPKTNLSHPKKFFLTIAFILGVVLISAIFFAAKKQEDASSKALFEQIFPEAQKKYDEGLAVITLNKNLAREDLTFSQKILNENKDKFKPESKESKKISELLKKVNDAVSSLSNAGFTEAKLVDSGKSELLSFEIKNPAEFYTSDSNNIYFLDTAGIYSSDKKVIIKNSWEKAGGLGTYLGNFYVLDRNSNQIFKFASGNYEKSNYLQETADLSKAVALTIDGSIWVLLKDGSILKFTKGKQDSFKISGLDKPFSSPSKIYTDKDIDNVYILDNGNSRIVVFNKEGIFKQQYQAPILKNATDFEVLEKEKKIFILSQGKVYEIGLK